MSVHRSCLICPVSGPTLNSYGGKERDKKDKKPILWRTAVVRVITTTIFILPLNISVATCPHYPNEEVRNIWEGGSGSNKRSQSHDLWFVTAQMWNTFFCVGNWSDPKTLFVFVTTNTICVCVCEGTLLCSQNSCLGRHKCSVWLNFRWRKINN